MKKRFAVLIVILCALTGAGLIWWKNGGRKAVQNEAAEHLPKIQMARLNITGIDEKSIHMVSETILTNNLPVELNIDSLDYEIFIDSFQVLESDYPKSISIEKSDSAVLRLPLELRMDKLKHILDAFEKQDRDSANYTVRARCRVKVPVAGKREFTINVTRRLPALRQIKFTQENVSIDKFGLKESDLHLAVKIQNKNVFPIRIRNGRYAVSVEKDFEAEGRLEKIVNVPGKGSERVDISMKVKTMKLPKLAWKTAFRDEKTQFRFGFSGTLISGNEMLQNSSIRMNAEGTLDELKELAKPAK